jgi:NADH-quinone oxidoreductase subunit C
MTATQNNTLRRRAGEQVVESLTARFGDFPVHEQRRDLLRFRFPQKDILPVLSFLKDHTPFKQLTHLTVVDWLEENQFELIYLLTAAELHTSIMVCIRLDRDSAQAESVFPLWLQAETYEQEINEMFGIDFPGSPRQGIPFILEGWDDMPPMRRDFDTVKYCERVHPERPGREHEDSRIYVGRKVGEKGYLK